MNLVEKMRLALMVSLVLGVAGGCDPGFDDFVRPEEEVFPADTIRGQVLNLGTAFNHVCAATADGALYCWGNGDFGQLGDGNHRSMPGPVRIRSEARFADSGGGYYHTCALDTSGEVWCWGNSVTGMLGHERTDAVVGGDPAEPIASTPYPVETTLRFSQLRTSGEIPVICALEPSGIAWCWGRIALGIGTSSASPRPVPVAGEHSFTELAVGGSHACALDRQGAAWCWGSNANGQIGTSSNVTEECGFPYSASCALEPVPVVTAVQFVAISAGYAYTCALSTQGEAWCWGDASVGQTGTGEVGGTSDPTRVSGDHRFASISAGTNHACGLTIEGEAWCWGNGNVGILGTEDGLRTCGLDSANRCSPEPVPVSGGFRFELLAAGGGFTCGVGTDNRILCWGANSFGTLGTGRFGGSQTTPVALVAQE